MKKLAPGVERRRLLSVIIALVFCLSAVLGLLIACSSDRTDTAVREGPISKSATPVRALVLTVHDPIYIDGNAGFTAPNASTGVTRGSGTATDPYIIEGWNISSSSSYGIHIQYADVHFVIQECYVRDVSEWGGVNVFVDFCSNGTVRKCTCIGNENETSFGIMLRGLHGCSLIDNSCSNNYYGIDLYISDNITLNNNNCTSSDRGIYVEMCENVTFAGNTASGNYVGIESHDNRDMRILDSRLSANKYYGILIYGGRGYTVTRNEIGSNQWSGIYAERISDSTFEGSEINSNGHFGLGLGLAHNITISGNNLSYNWLGGISLYRSSSVTVFHNNLVGAPLAVDDGMGTENSWDNGYPDGGNYWGDYEGHDKNNGPAQDVLGEDCIGDTPYYINESLNIKDNYPLMGPWGDVSSPETHLWSQLWIWVVMAIAIIAVIGCVLLLRRRNPPMPGALEPPKEAV